MPNIEFQRNGPLLDSEAEALAAHRRRRRREAALLAEDCERYEKTLGDKRLFYAEIASFGCSLIVGVCEGVPATFCVERAAVAVVATTAQAVLECLTLVPAERFLQLVMAALVIPMSIAVLVMAVIGAEGAPPALAEAVDVLSLVVNGVGLALLAVGIGSGAVEVLTDRLTGLSDAEASVTGSPAIDLDSIGLSSEVCLPRGDRLSVDLGAANAEVPDAKEFGGGRDMDLDLDTDTEKGQRAANHARAARRKAGADRLHVASDARPRRVKRAPVGASVLIVPVTDDETGEAVGTGGDVDGSDIDLDIGLGMGPAQPSVDLNPED